MNGVDPPDPGGGYILDPSNSPIPMDTESVHPSRKRQTPPNSDYSLPQKKNTVAQVIGSVQSVYTLPEFEGNRKRYLDQDVAPFLIHVSKDCEISSSSSLRPIKFGHFLHHNNIKDVAKDGVKRIGRNRVSVQFKTAVAANSFLDHPGLAAAKYNAVIPSYNVTRMGIVRSVPVEWTLEELVSSIEVPDGFGRVIRARRLNKKSIENNTPIWTPTPTVVLTFIGQKLPDRVYCFFNSLPVQTYILPTIQCNNCCRFGHVATQCRSNARCFICAKSHSGIECNSLSPIPTCLFCSGNHKAIDTSCPEYSRQKSIKLVMSQENISYNEAAVRFPQVRRSFADISRTPPPPFPTQSSQTLTQSFPHTQAISNSVSYRRTYCTQKSPPAPASSPGYDRQAHQAIVITPPSSLPNGSAYPSDDVSPNDNLLELLLSTILNIFSRFGDFELPNNVMSKLTELNKIIKNAQIPTMELSQHSSQEE